MLLKPNNRFKCYPIFQIHQNQLRFLNLLAAIIFENENFVAINKPAGLLSIPDRMQSEVSLKDMLINKYGSIFTVHRLDKDTSGIIIFAKNETTHKFLSQAFEERRVEKYYRGYCAWFACRKKRHH